MGCWCSDTRGGKQAVDVGRSSGPGVSVPAASAAMEAGEAVDLFVRHRGVAGPSSHVELSFSASKLQDLDFMSKSDPMAVVYARTRDGTLEEISRTEVILNTLNPVWVTKAAVMYQFEIVQQLIFKVYDIDTKFYNIPVKKLKLEEQDFLGEAYCTLAEIVTRKSITLNLQNSNGSKDAKNYGTITVRADETSASRMMVEIIFRCADLENTDIFSKSDPFLIISKIVETGDAIPICKTEVINNNLNPIWKPIFLCMQQFGGKVNPLIIECFDFNSNGRHKLIGKVQKSLAGLENLHMQRIGANFQLPSAGQTDHEKILKSQLFVDRFSETSQYTFLDYISSGFELNFMVAIDFTASNGNPRQTNSLHYIDPSSHPNAYQRAILEVGDVIQFYDSDKQFSAWGFGGRPMGRSISHCFNLNGSNEECEVVGIEGIMSAYSRALQTVSLAGPTLFGEVISKAAQIANRSSSDNHNKYYVLLIITDGVITDIEETKNSIVWASDLPLSILIIGVGSADFKEMKILDADDGELLQNSTGRIARRDIVQFVPMREMLGEQISIAQSLLEELPSQFLTYMRSRGIEPSFVQDLKT